MMLWTGVGRAGVVGVANCTYLLVTGPIARF